MKFSKSLCACALSLCLLSASVHALAATPVQESEPNDTWNTAQVVTDDTTVSAILSSDMDADWYQVTAEETGYANFWAKGTASSVSMALYDANGTRLLIQGQEDAATHQTSVLRYLIRPGETYYIRISGESTGYEFRFRSYSDCAGTPSPLAPALQAVSSVETSVSETLGHNSSGTAQAIAEHTTVNGSLSVSVEPYDQDWYRVSFDQSGRANFWVSGTTGPVTLELYDSDGQKLLDSGASAAGSVQSFIEKYAVESGKEYYVKLSGTQETMYQFCVRLYV